MASEPTDARIQELEAVVAQLKQKLTKYQKADVTRLTDLKQYDKEHPEKVAERVKRYKEKNREALLARRRELYKQKKQAITPDGLGHAPPVSPN